ncbi:MAG: HDIG domain-containing protein [Elusimicrobiota bacterium]|jgi:putative nucleotidyltransferase with HDIG domain|nr:HDIG domain-containing protein [Elusimicrobiota bacterium]
MKKIKQWIIWILIRTARDLNSSNKSRGPVMRNTKQFFTKEIKIPVIITAVVASIIVYFMILLALGPRYDAMIAVLILTITILFAFVSEIRKERTISNNNDAMVLICFILIIGILAMQITQEYISIFAFPIGAFVVMGVMLVNSRIALVYAIILSLIAGILSAMNFIVFFVLFGSSMFVLNPSKNIRNRSDFVGIGLRAAVASIAILTIFYLLDAYAFDHYKFYVYYSLLSGFFTAVILLVIMPIFEKIFSRTTSIKLIELADFNNPLLKTLMLEAPGTYHHCIMTAALAESAALAIKEDSILARVSAYYHDIGKIKNPKYFVENQLGGKNPHDPITPAMSALILSSHVKDGVILAKQYNLDDSIIDAIRQHHGTTLMAYFYHKALEQNPDIDKSGFTYEGPRPRSKITAIIMLADSCEAVCHAIEEISNVKIKDAVDKIFETKVKEKQFEKCPITMRELDEIKESITATLLGMYHARIPYADDEKTKNNNNS